MKNTTTATQRFHGSYEIARARSNEVDFAALQSPLASANLDTVTVVDHHRTVSYRFYPHFHPYVQELVRRLNKGSLTGLQDADTEYVQNPDGTLDVLPDSLTVKLATPGILVSRPEGETVLPVGLILSLPDGVMVTVAGGDFPLPGKMVLSPARGVRVGVDKTILFGDELTLKEEISLVLPDGTPVVLPKSTKLILHACKPRPKLYEPLFTTENYDPTALVQHPYPIKDLDFTASGPYAVYNWELFYHVPLMVAINLSKNQRFAEAQQWFHYIFDPTTDSDGPTPERFWKVKPFQYTEVKKIEEILINLSSGLDPALRQETIDSIGAWKDAPFRPHQIARFRQTAYMYKTVMAYLDNLIAWGDSLFRQDTGESINEATQFYVLAANILGPRPQAVPRSGAVRPQTYENIRADLDQFGNVLRDLESDIPFDLAPPPSESADMNRLATLSSLGSALYFGVPRNEKLLSYWDTVADRLFKIRNSLNILGVFRKLALFEPPIDPALLARATAAGVDIAAVVAGRNQPLGPMRFQFLVQKAVEICGEVKSLGNNLLSAMEKEDNEALSVLRAKHERVILGLAETVKYAQWQETIKAREGLEQSLANAAQRYIYYERLLGKKENEIEIPHVDELDIDSLNKMKFKATEAETSRREIPVDIAQGGAGAIGKISGGLLGASDITGGKMISSYEAEELDKLESARGLQMVSAGLEMLGSGLGLIPQFDADVEPLGVGAGTGFGGVQLSRMVSGQASAIRIAADQLTYEASRAAKIGGYARREQEWSFQSNLAAGEINQLLKQLRGAQIREAIAEREWKNHQQQVRNAEEIERFLTDEKIGKKTNQGFYAWMKREVKGLYGQCFQFAFDVAKKSERALQYELGNPDLSFIQFSYLAGKEGLLAGEKLFFDIKRMEMSYHELNQREYEMTQHISLLQLNPNALLQLRATGRCAVTLPEEMFDMNAPGHYFRRIKSVAVSIPCVTGPYTGVNCTLRLQKSAIRKNALLRGDVYAREGAEDDRFSDCFGSLQAIVTSSGQNDSGLFETNLRDERYLPFESAGAISEWSLELPANPSKDEPKQFDYNTISDVILHMRYTAREGGNLLRDAAIKNLNSRITTAQAAGSVSLFSVKHEFPSDWAKFKSVTASTSQRAELSIILRPEQFPFWSQGKAIEVKRIDVIARTGASTIEVFNKATDIEVKKDTLQKDVSLGGLCVGKLANIFPQRGTVDKLSLYFANNSVDDLWFALTWGFPEG